MKRIAPIFVGIATTAVLVWPLGAFECWIYTRNDPGDACIPLFFLPVAIAVGMLAGLMLHWKLVKRKG